uniref:Predicted gene 10999 n=1 Tax=Mus spicilegus TaxID=10103 RepID=A0A8C6H6N2_MUSSI
DNVLPQSSELKKHENTGSKNGNRHNKEITKGENPGDRKPRKSRTQRNDQTQRKIKSSNGKRSNPKRTQ